MRAHPAGPRHGDLVHEHAPTTAPSDLNQLLPEIWSKGVRRGDSGVLTVHGRDVTELAGEFGTPLFLLDEQDFRERARGYVEAFAGADVYYASKAFSCTAVVRWAAQEGLSIDVATGGELAIALAADFPGEAAVSRQQ